MDKVKHFAVGFILAVSTVIAMYWGLHLIGINLPRTAIALSAFGVTALAALWKEDKDYDNGGKFDWWDVVATLVPGLLIGTIVLIYF